MNEAKCHASWQSFAACLLRHGIAEICSIFQNFNGIQDSVGCGKSWTVLIVFVPMTFQHCLTEPKCKYPEFVLF